MATGKLAEGKIIEALPNDLYRVACDEGGQVIASLGGAARQSIVRVIPGDRVLVEISSRDPSRGKIKRRLI